MNSTDGINNGEVPEATKFFIQDICTEIVSYIYDDETEEVLADHFVSGWLFPIHPEEKEFVQKNVLLQAIQKTLPKEMLTTIRLENESEVWLMRLELDPDSMKWYIILDMPKSVVLLYEATSLVDGVQRFHDTFLGFSYRIGGYL